MGNEVEEIKERIDIVEFIRGYLELRKSGINYKGLCPFHQEKTPSFMVNPERRIFKCFGCNEGGDVFEFLMKMEGLNFPEALEMLAARAGVTLPKQRKAPAEYQKEKDTKTRLFEINSWSAKVFHELLVNHKAGKIARDYLDGRSINKKTIKKWQIGFAPSKMILTSYLIKKQYRPNEIKQAGSPDRFRNRIIFPIWDVMDNVVGFTGRALEAGQEPKYYNTPESPIFHKSKVLYGLNFAKVNIREKKQAILVEGQTDVVLSRQAGVENVVASSGTALTEDHLKILARYTDNICFCFDNDVAGFTACKKAIIMAYDLELAPSVIEIPKEYKDVGEIIEKDAKIWGEISKKNLPAFEWLIKKSFEKYPKNPNPNERRQIAKELISALIHIADPVETRHYKKIMAQKLGVGERIIEETIERFLLLKHKNIRTHSTSSGQAPEQKNQSLKNKLSIEENLIGLLFAYPEQVTKIISELDWQEFSDKNLSEVYKSLQHCYTTDKCADTKKVFDSKSKKEKADILVMQILEQTRNYSEEEIAEEILDCARRIKGQKKEEIKSQYARAINEAESLGDRKKLKELIEKFQREISRK